MSNVQPDRFWYSTAHLRQSALKFVASSDGDLLAAASLFGVRASSALIMFGLQVLLAQSLGLSGYGVYVYLWAWLIIIAHIGVLGLSESVIRFVPRYIERGRFADAKGFLLTGLGLSAAGGLTLAAAGLGVILWYPTLLSGPYSNPTIVVALGVPIAVVELYLLGVCRSLGYFLLGTVPGYIIRPVLIACGVAAGPTIGFEPSATLVLALAVAITGIMVVVQCLIIYLQTRNVFHAHAKTTKRHLWLRATLPLLIVFGVDELFHWSDIVILGLLGSADELAVYFAAVRCMALASFVHYAFMAVTSRRFSMAYASKDHRALQASVTQASDMTFWLTIPIVVLMLVLANPLLAFFGPEFVDGVPVMAMIGFGLIVRASIGNGADLLVMLGYQKAAVIIASMALALNIILAIVLIPTMGILGAAMSTVLAHAGKAAAIATVAHRCAGINVIARSLPRFSSTNKVQTASPSNVSL